MLVIVEIICLAKGKEMGKLYLIIRVIIKGSGLTIYKMDKEFYIVSKGRYWRKGFGEKEILLNDFFKNILFVWLNIVINIYIFNMLTVGLVLLPYFKLNKNMVVGSIIFKKFLFGTI